MRAEEQALAGSILPIRSSFAFQKKHLRPSLHSPPFATIRRHSSPFVAIRRHSSPIRFPIRVPKKNSLIAHPGGSLHRRGRMAAEQGSLIHSFRHSFLIRPPFAFPKKLPDPSSQRVVAPQREDGRRARIPHPFVTIRSSFVPHSRSQKGFPPLRPCPQCFAQRCRRVSIAQSPSLIVSGSPLPRSSACQGVVSPSGSPQKGKEEPEARSCGAVLNPWTRSCQRAEARRSFHLTPLSRRSARRRLPPSIRRAACRRLAANRRRGCP